MRIRFPVLLFVLVCASCSTVADDDRNGAPSVATDHGEDFPSYAQEAARTDLVCSEDGALGEAREPLAWSLVLLAACLVAGTWAAEYGCKKHILEEICPPGTVVTKTVHDSMDKNKSVTVRLPCDALETMICGTSGLTGAEVLRRMCAGLI